MIGCLLKDGSSFWQKSRIVRVTKGGVTQMERNPKVRIIPAKKKISESRRLEYMPVSAQQAKHS